MLNDIILVSEKDTLFSSNWLPDTDTRIYPSLLLDAGDRKEIQNAYVYCSEHHPPHFSITLLLSNPLQEECIQYLLSFTFMPNYRVANNRTMLYLLANDEQLLADTKKIIQEAAVKQGVNIVIYQLRENETVSSIDSKGVLFTSTDNLLAAYKSSLQQLNNCNKTFYLHAPQQQDVQKLYGMITALEKDAQKNKPELYQLAKEKQSLLAAHEELKKRQQLAENELNNYKLHLETMRSSHQAKELQDYYNNEYEVLPLWYKRFGHIIKVIMGKRSFKSLFTDNIKKRTD